ncbi:hypothetical protein LXL04_013362 [Taraxacum kok-saghyz]
MAKKKVVSRSEESPSDSTNSVPVNKVRTRVRYVECQRNLAVRVGGNAVDGCPEFTASQAEGMDGSLMCTGCGCHRNFHRKVVECGSCLTEIKFL